MSTSITLKSLHIYPVKSCAGVARDAVDLIDTGLDLDRLWMVVDASGSFVSQRELPRMALVTPTVKHSEVVLRAPGMLALHLPLDAADRALQVRLWDEALPAYDMGAAAAQWFTDFLGEPGLRLVRFDPDHERLSSRTWTGEAKVRNAFSDGFPLLVLSQASLDELNRRLAGSGHAAVDWRRFRPNLLIDGVAAHEEDFIDTLHFGDVTLKLVKPCPRCPIPNVNPDSGVPSPEVIDTLSGYRANAQLNGALAFGMNAYVQGGDGAALQRGQQGRVTLRF